MHNITAMIRLTSQSEVALLITRVNILLLKQKISFYISLFLDPLEETITLRFPPRCCVIFNVTVFIQEAKGLIFPSPPLPVFGPYCIREVAHGSRHL